MFLTFIRISRSYHNGIPYRIPRRKPATTQVRYRLETVGRSAHE